MEIKLQKPAAFLFCITLLATNLFCREIVRSNFQSAPASEASSGRVPHVWLDPDGKPLFFQDDQAVMEFLLTAKIVDSKKVGEGVNHIRKVLLEKDGVRMHAAFRSVKISKGQIRLGKLLLLRFRDDCRFEIAAYRLGKLLGLNNIPPVVVRKVRGKKGTLQAWLENSVVEKDRLDRNLTPLNHVAWRHQRQTMYLFDNLICNIDRNQGNIVYDSDWNLWMIDHTRGFQQAKMLQNENRIRQCDRDVWNRMQQLNKAQLKSELKDVLTNSAIDLILKRRDMLVDYMKELIETMGEEKVFFSDKG